jgi:hypothetical protein
MSPRNIFSAVTLCGFLSLSTLAFGGNSGIEVDLKGAPKNAQVRIEALDKKTKPMDVKPDARGKVAVSQIAPGSYRVSVIVDGKVRVSQKMKVQANKPTVVALKVPPASTASTTAIPAGAKTKVVDKKLYVWVPGPTGSRFGGYWKEAGKATIVTDENGNTTTGGEQMMEDAQRQQRSSRSSPGQ